MMVTIVYTSGLFCWGLFFGPQEFFNPKRQNDDKGVWEYALLADFNHCFCTGNDCKG